MTPCNSGLMVLLVMLTLLVVAVLLLTYRRVLSLQSEVHAAVLFARGIGTVVDSRKAIDSSAVTRLADKVESIERKMSPAGEVKELARDTNVVVHEVAEAVGVDSKAMRLVEKRAKEMQDISSVRDTKVTFETERK